MKWRVPGSFDLIFYPHVNSRVVSTPWKESFIDPKTVSQLKGVILTLRAAFQLSVFYTYVHARKSLNFSKQFVFNK